MLTKILQFDLFFRVISYLTVFFGFFSIWVSGTFGLFETILFLLFILISWKLESSSWQISERIGTTLIVLALPIFFILWKLNFFSVSGLDTAVAGILARLILSLTIIKLLQKKSDRDWIFLYLMSFFEVLLAAGLSISSLYLGSLILYLLIVTCAIISFEIRKTSITVLEKNYLKQTNTPENVFKPHSGQSVKRLPLTSLALVFFIILVATPLFFILPRVGGAGFGGGLNNVSTYTGFSDEVKLGDIGRVQQNEQVVMRVRLDDNNQQNIRWRGIALDRFDNQTWSKTNPTAKDIFLKGDRDYFIVDAASGRNNMVTQTIFLEPINSPILFSMSRPLVIQGDFSRIYKDTDGGVSFARSGYERQSYKVVSDRSTPEISKLRADTSAYPSEYKRYWLVPEDLDPRVRQLTTQLTQTTESRYDKALIIEKYLQNNFGYTLDLKAGGNQPMVDFLFNVREGHCEYFATSMAIMLRTQGIATRVVNGFQKGEYNETADVFVVKQRNAHSWVEVYFPKENVWIPFDPTPFGGQSLESNSTGILGKFNSYIEALETFWIQYFVAYDNQEQRSLFNSVKSGFVDYQAKTSSWLTDKQEKLADWWREVRGEKGFETSALAISYGIGYLGASILGIVFIIWLYRRIIKFAIWKRLFEWVKRKNDATIIEFYERMQMILANQGFMRQPHQTPLEFAYELNLPEAVNITEKYNRVRFGEKDLTNDEAVEIEKWLNLLENQTEK